MDSTAEARWVEVILHIPAQTLDVVGEALFGIGAVAVTELVHDHRYDLWGNNRQKLEVGERPTRLHVKALFSELEGLDYRHKVERMLLSLAPDFPGVQDTEVIVSPLENQDWNQVWRSKFSVTPLTSKITVRPEWIDYTAKPEEVLIHLGSLMAFGTGTHETTRSCARLLESWLVEHKQAKTLLDVGTGSGILAIIGVKLGLEKARAIDIDPLAVESSQINRDLNELSSQIDCDDTPVQDIQQTYDVVMANILAGALVELMPAITQTVGTHSALILSGILLEQGPSVVEAYQQGGFTVLRKIEDGDWLSLLLTRSP